MNTPEWLEVIKQKRERAMLSSLAHHKDVTALLQLVEKQREALNQIAAWHDGPVVASWFDSPGDAEIARKALLFKPEGVEA